MSAYEKTLMRVMLACNHTVEIAVPIPEVGDEQYCVRCNDWKTVVQHLDNYFIRCLAKHSYGRTFGADADKAIHAARKHVKDNPRHTVLLGKNGKRIVEIDNVAEALFVSPEQLRQVAADAAQILRQIDDKALTSEVPLLDASESHANA